MFVDNLKLNRLNNKDNITFLKVSTNIEKEKKPKLM